MASSLRVALADDHAEILGMLDRMVRLLGHHVVSIARTGNELVAQCLATRPDVVITDIVMPGMDGLEAARIIQQELPAPVILLSGYYSHELVQRAAEHQILDYLLKPVSSAQLGPAIALAHKRFGDMRQLQREADHLRRSLAEHQVIERARHLMMFVLGLNDDEASQRLARWAARYDHDLLRAAREFIASEELLRADAHQV